MEVFGIPTSKQAVLITLGIELVKQARGAAREEAIADAMKKYNLTRNQVHDLFNAGREAEIKQMEKSGISREEAASKFDKEYGGKPEQHFAECNKPVRYSGGLAGGEYTVYLHSNSGAFDFFYSNYTVPDQFDIFYEGNRIAGTGCQSTGGDVNNPVFDKIYIPYMGNSNVITVKVIGNCSGQSNGNKTEWQFVVQCAD